MLVEPAGIEPATSYLQSTTYILTLNYPSLSSTHRFQNPVLETTQEVVREQLR